MHKIHSAADLDALYEDSEQADKKEFAKMRSNLLLIAGDHYNTSGRHATMERLRGVGVDRGQSKLRLVNNHFGRIFKRYVDVLMNTAPDVKPSPKNPRELQDKKAAEHYDAIWADGKQINRWDKLKIDLFDDFIGIGEVYAKVFFDANAGSIIGYEPKLDDNKQPIIDPQTGEPVADERRPVREGQTFWERLYAFNILLDPCSDGFDDSSYVCIRKTVPLARLKRAFPDKAEQIAESGEKKFLVFDVDSGYRQSDKKKETLLKEWYFRPSDEYPNGYYYISISGLILDEDELPLGYDKAPLFPVIGEYAEKVQTKRRGMSPLDPLRPFQKEINRAYSKMAETQITLGDDKVILRNGSKVSSGAVLPGMRTFSVSGDAPTIMAGRSGEQYLPYAQAKTSEMYQVGEIAMEDDEITAQVDPHALLYRSATQKRRFSRYTQRFECFLKSLFTLHINTCKTYYSDERYVRAVGTNEAVNIAEFKKHDSQSVQIVVEASSEDIETRLGRHLTFQHILQYVGNQLDPGSIGKIIKNLPYSNFKDSVSDLTIDEEMAENDMLALDRGELPVIQVNDPHDFLIKRANHRMKQADFKVLSEDIRENYQVYIEAHSDVLQQEKDALIRANSGFIPDSGAFVKADYYVKDPENPDLKARRAEFPQSALDWLWNKLEEQGSFRNRMDELPTSVQAGVSPEELAQMSAMQDPNMPSSVPPDGMV